MWAKGYLYSAFGKRYVDEAEISARSLRRFTELPVCLVTDDASYKNPLFDHIIVAGKHKDFVVKIIGMQLTPFEKTIFLDSDTFVCSTLDPVFEVLDIFDMAMTVERSNHSYAFFQKYNPAYTIKYENVLPEYNTGVIAYNMNQAVRLLLQDWMQQHALMQVKADMPSFREAFIQHAQRVHIAPLPFEYNYHGTHSFGFATNEIKVFHERTGEKWGTLTTVMESFEAMDKRARRVNKFKGKRIVVPYFGVLPYYWSPFRIKQKIKQMLGIKKTKKAETFRKEK